MSDCATPWTVAHQAPLSMEFSRQEYWSGLPFPIPGDHPNPGVEPMSPALQVDSLPSEPPGQPLISRKCSLRLLVKESLLGGNCALCCSPSSVVNHKAVTRLGQVFCLSSPLHCPLGTSPGQNLPVSFCSVYGSSLSNSSSKCSLRIYMLGGKLMCKRTLIALVKKCIDCLHLTQKGWRICKSQPYGFSK